MGERRDWRGTFDRPPICPDRTCTPLIRPLTDSDNKAMSDPSYAVHCFGVMAEPLVWTFNGVEHAEDLRTCSYSPLKGVVMWLENLSDWEVLRGGYAAAISAVTQEAERHG